MTSYNDAGLTYNEPGWSYNGSPPITYTDRRKTRIGQMWWCLPFVLLGVL